MEKIFKDRLSAEEFANIRLMEALEDNYQMAVYPIDYDAEKDEYIVVWRKEKVRRLKDD